MCQCAKSTALLHEFIGISVMTELEQLRQEIAGHRLAGYECDMMLSPRNLTALFMTDGCAKLSLG